MRTLLKIIFSLSCWLCFYTSFGQDIAKIDNLLHIVKTQAEDTVKVKAFNELAWELRTADAPQARDYARQAITLSESLAFERGRITGLVRLGQIAIYQREYDTAAQLYQEALKAEIKENYPYGIGRAKSGLSEVYRNKGDLNQALTYGLEALKAFEEINHKISIALIANKIGVIYKEMGAYNKAMQYFLKGLDIREQMGNPKAIGISSLSIGSFYITLEDNSKAIDYLNKSKAIFETLKDEYELAKVYNNLGVAYFKLKNNDSALTWYKKSLSLKKQLGLENKDVSTYTNIGAIYHRENKLDSALKYYQKSISIAQSNPGGKALVEAYMNIGDIYCRKNNHKEAIATYQKALQLAETSDKKVAKLKILNELSRNYERLKQYDSALHYSNRYIGLNDDIEQTYKTAVELKADYEEEQKENALLAKDKALLIVENRRKNTLIYSLIIGLLLALLLFFSILRENRQKQKTRLSEKKAQIAEKDRQLGEQKIEELLRNQELKSIDAMREGQEKEQKRIAKDLHDRLGSMLAMVKLHFKSVEDNIEHLRADNKKQYEKANTLLDSACEEVRKIAHNMTSGVLMKFGLVAALEDLKDKLEQTRQVKVDFIAHGLDNRLENDAEITLYRIIQELISNILKHAEAREITIQLVKSNSGLNIVVEDDGLGFDLNNRKDSGMGLKNVAARVDTLNGELNIDSTPGNGTTITIDIPL